MNSVLSVGRTLSLIDNYFLLLLEFLFKIIRLKFKYLRYYVISISINPSIIICFQKVFII